MKQLPDGPFGNREILGDLFNRRPAFEVFNDGVSLNTGTLDDWHPAYFSRIDLDERAFRPIDQALGQWAHISRIGPSDDK